MSKKHIPSSVVCASSVSIEGLVGAAASEFLWMNKRLIAIAHEIETITPMKSGIVRLYFSIHHKSCLGCPHLVWKRWQYHPLATAKHWQAHPITNPVSRLPRNGRSPELRTLVQEALAIEKHRSALIKPLSSLRKILWNTSK